MATVWTPTRTEGGNTWRLGLSLEVTGQPGNNSFIEWRILIQRTSSLFPIGIAWYQPIRAGAGVHPWQGQLGPDMCLLDSGIVSVQHKTNGTADPYTLWVAHATNAGTSSNPKVGDIVVGSQRNNTITPPTINRLPSAPSTVTFSTSLEKVSASSAVAAENGAAPILEYQVQMEPVGGGTPVNMAVSGRTGTVAAPGRFGTSTKARARARSLMGWGPYSALVPYMVPARLGLRPQDTYEVPCQVAERYVGGGQWVPCTVIERFDGTNWNLPAPN